MVSGEIPVAFFFALLLELGEHYDNVDSFLEDHLPEIGAGVREGTLTGDVFYVSSVTLEIEYNSNEKVSNNAGI